MVMVGWKWLLRDCSLARSGIQSLRRFYNQPREGRWVSGFFEMKVK